MVLNVSILESGVMNLIWRFGKAAFRRRRGSFVLWRSSMGL